MGKTSTKYYYKPLSCVISWNSKEEMNGKMMFLFLVCELYKRLILLMTKKFIIRCATIDVSCLTKECAYSFIFSTRNNAKMLIILSYARPLKQIIIFTYLQILEMYKIFQPYLYIRNVEHQNQMIVNEELVYLLSFQNDSLNDFTYVF